MRKIIVGISANEKPIAPNSPITHLSSSVNFADGVKKAGALPVYLPVSSVEEAKVYAEVLDALILTGGQDVHPSQYGQEIETQKNDYNPARDDFELALIELFLEKKKPILAVCRGMQLLNVYLGGTLHQEIENHSQGLPIGYYHSIDVLEGSQLADYFKTGDQINSVHHQAIDQVGQGLIVTARDPRDGIIEAMELPGYPLLAVQWHPEFLIEEEGGDQSLFDDLVKKAEQEKNNSKGNVT